MPGLLDFFSPSVNDPVALARLRRQKLDELKHNADLESEYGDKNVEFHERYQDGQRGYAHRPAQNYAAGATASDIASLEGDINDDPYTGTSAQDAHRKREQQLADESTYMSPGATAVRQSQQKDKLLQLLAVPEQQGKNALALEEAQTRGKIRVGQAEQDSKQKFVESMLGGGNRAADGATHNGGGLNSGEPGSYKMSINASGDPTFQPVMMSALVQRAHGQLQAARDRTLSALEEAERLYPGINDSATTTDKNTSGSALGRMFSSVTGIGAPQYGGPGSRAEAGLERLNYTMGNPTPFANLAQEASFGNIEQMAGQLPGVRGLATITPMFKEHQSRWGHETPLATVQRLRHMAHIMDETIKGIEGGDGSQEPQ